MEFNTTTFSFEIVNFLILLWILQRIFYKPILETIAKRKQHIDLSLQDAKKLRQEAEELRSLYENRQQRWEQEKKSAQAELQQQFDIDRRVQLENLQKELMLERQKAQNALIHQQDEYKQQVERQALENGARFATLLLQKTATPEVEQQLVAMLITQLDNIPISHLLSNPLTDSVKSFTAKVASVYPIADTHKLAIEHKLRQVINRPMTFDYQQDATLIAGVRIDIGAWVFHANLQHELEAFAQIAYESEQV